MAYVDKHLAPGETVLAKARMHWRYFVVPILSGAISLTLIVLGMSGGSPTAWLSVLGLLGVLIGLVSAAIAWLQTKTTELAVTNQRVIAKSGIISQHTIEQRLDKSAQLEIKRSIFGLILNYGNLMVVGTGASLLWVRFVANPMAFRKAVQAAQHDMENRPRS